MAFPSGDIAAAVAAAKKIGKRRKSKFVFPLQKHDQPNPARIFEKNRPLRGESCGASLRHNSRGNEVGYA